MVKLLGHAISHDDWRLSILTCETLENLPAVACVVQASLNTNAFSLHLDIANHHNLTATLGIRISDSNFRKVCSKPGISRSGSLEGTRPESVLLISRVQSEAHFLSNCRQFTGDKADAYAQTLTYAWTSHSLPLWTAAVAFWRKKLCAPFTCFGARIPRSARRRASSD